MSICRPCRHLGCPKYVVDDRYCPDHANENAMRSAERSANTPAFRKYSSQGPFVKLSRLLKAQNYQCQRLVKGVRCERLSEITHHRLSPTDRPDLKLSVYDENGVSQLIALCREHHPPTDGTPHWIEGKIGDRNADFIRTEFGAISF